MLTLVTADLHLTDRENDAYRWKFLSEWIWQQTFNNLIILGDLTEEKDYHSSVLVNRVVCELTALAREGIGIHVLMGNHDYTQKDNPFFKFLSTYPNCFYYSEQRIVEISNTRWAFFPHSHEPDWEPAAQFNEIGIDFVCCHQCFSGAISESGHKVDGCSYSPLENVGKVWSGDLHTPQRVGPVEYIGAPYPIHFGDSFSPRVVLIDGTKCRNLYPPSIQKLVLHITDPDQIEHRPTWQTGDQVKVVLTIRRREFNLWESYRRQIKDKCKRNGLVLCGIELKERRREKLHESKPHRIPASPQEQFSAFVKYAKVDQDDVEVGRALL